MSKSVVAVYESHDKAVRAVTHLTKNGIDEKGLSIVGKGETVEDHIHVVPVKGIKMAPAFIGAAVGAVLGGIAGVSGIEIPGFGFIAGADATGFSGALGGVVPGVIAGFIVSAIFQLVYRKDELVVFKKHVEGGKYLVVVNGDESEVSKSRKLLHTENIHEELHDLEVK